MDKQRWQRIRELFTAAGRLPANERQDWLAAECAADPSLIDEVMALLTTATRAGSGLDEIIDEAAADYAEALPEGQRIGPYRILDTIGRGGMGQVYLAERADDEFRQQVAIKTVSWLGASPELVQRFRIERQILADLSHPCIARLLDGGQADNGTPYLVMEYIDGQTITRWCEQRGLPLRERLALFLKVCDAVRYAHRNLVIHRDIKPSNILVDAAGVPRLLDFGIARLLEPGGRAGAGLTRADMRVLTPEYASPEQIRGEPATTATDVYGLGLLLYELLAGRFPYDISDSASPDLASLICNTEPPAPSAAVVRDGAGTKVSLAGDLDNIVMMALRKEPERRYESVAALADDIENYLASRPVSARSNSLAYRAGKFVRRNRSAVAVASAVLVTIVTMTGWHTQQLGNERDIAEQERETAEAATAFMIDLFGANDPGQSLGESLTAREVLDRGAEKLRDDSLADKPVVRARLLQSLGMVYERLGLYDEAQQFLEQGAELNRQVLPRDNETRIAGLEQLAWLYYRREDWPRVIELANEALSMRESLVGRNDPSLAESLNMLGTASFWIDDFDSTLRYYNRALAVLQGDSEAILTERAQTLNHLGITYAWLGRNDEAEQHYLESLALRLELFDERHPRIGAAKANLSAFYHGIAEYEKARTFALAALEIDRAALGDEHVNVAYDLGLLAAINIEQGNLEEAEDYAQRSADTWRAGLGPAHTRYGSALDRLATVQMERGRLDEALATAAECYDVIVAANGDTHSMASDALYTRGRVYLRRDEYEPARQDLEKALAIRASQLGEDSRAYQSTLKLLAQAELGLGNLESAERMSRRVLRLVEEAGGDDTTRLRQALNVLQQVLEASGNQERLSAVETRLAALPAE